MTMHRPLALAAAALLSLTAACGSSSTPTSPSTSPSASASTPAPATAGLTLEVAGVTHFFCSEACKQQFQQEPSGSSGTPAGTHAHDLPPDHGKGAHD